MSSAITILGRGEVGRRLGAGLSKAGWRVSYATRSDGWTDALAAHDTPRLLAMREEDVVAAFKRFPPAERGSLVLVQNGFLEAGFTGEELEGTTRALVWFTSKGDFYQPLRASILHGPYARVLAEGWNHAGIPFDVARDEPHFLREMIIKGFWNTVVGLPLAVHGCELGSYLETHVAEIEALAEETCAVCAAVYGVDVAPSDAIATLHETTEHLHWIRSTSAKALAWRNGAIASWGQIHGIATPVNDHLLVP